MKRLLWGGFWAIFVFALAAGGFTMLTPKIGHATRAEIDAVLPASLKVEDRPNPEGLRRYEEVAKVASSLQYKDVDAGLDSPRKAGDPAAAARALTAGRQPIAEVDRILALGDLWYPQRKADTLFRDAPNLKSFSKLLTLATQEAVKRGDRAGAAHYAALNLRYGRALREAGGVFIDVLVAIATEAIAVRSAYEAEMKGALDEKGRALILAELPPETGTLPQMGAAVRRDFQVMFLPLLLNPDQVIRTAAASSNADSRQSMPGTFDPIATAKIAGEIYDAAIKDADLPLDKQSGTASRLSAEAAAELPHKDGRPEFLYRIQMNMGQNTIGRTLLSASIFDQLALTTRRRAADRNILRAVLLLHEGQNPVLVDPFGKGPLKIDRQRRIVWSVGEDGKDDNGDIPTGALTRAPDQGRKW